MNSVRNILAQKRMACALTVLCIGLSACSRHDQPPKPVALVNDRAITALELDAEMLTENMQSGANLSREQVLSTLIDRRLLQAEALRSKLDRDPVVSAAIENAKAEVLAQAYLKSRVVHADKPGKDEIAAYFKQHPASFSERKLVDLVEIEVPARHISDEFKAVVKNAQDLEDIAAWLEGQRIFFTQSKTVRSSADLPAVVTAELNKLQKGQMFMTNDGKNALVAAIRGIHESPVSLEAASAEIEQILINQRKRELGEAERLRLRSIAKIEYLNEGEQKLAKASQR